uniref:galactosyltransferase-related protein n=1 Tax=Acidiphilium sp. TaxID=527 RepID=UPI00259086C0
ICPPSHFPTSCCISDSVHRQFRGLNSPGVEGHRIRPDSDNTLHVTVPVDYFSGVILVDKGQYLAANGYSNLYQGWGYEDGDFHSRLKALGLQTVVRNGTFTPLAHDSDGFTDEGTPSVSSRKNKELFERLSESYHQEKRFPEGVDNLQVASVSVGFERWQGLDESESMLICRLKVAQVSAILPHVGTEVASSNPTWTVGFIKIRDINSLSARFRVLPLHFRSVGAAARGRGFSLLAAR